MSDAAAPPAQGKAGPYSWYVLFVLFLVYALNFIDRQILTILAPDIRRDLGLSHADIGFLYGTAFGVFYALFGIPLGRLADGWHRVRLMTLGLALWSTMTALSGLARSGGALAAARIGVGIGEATSGPSAYSLISDWFPKRQRATALALYSAGIYFGGGFSLFIGGSIAQHWNAAWPNGGPGGLVGWQAAFMAVGLPGLLLALWVATLREPLRGRSEGLATPPHPAPFRAFFDDLVTILPPLTLIGAARTGARALATNLLVLGLLAAAVFALVRLGEPLPQWLAVATGIYAVFSWSSALRRRDPATFRLILGTPAFLCVVLAYGLNAFLAYAVAGLAPSYAAQVFQVSSSEAGLWIGGPAILGGFAGVTLGGIAADRLRQRYAAGRIMVVLFGAVAPVVPMIVAFTTSDKTLFYAMLPLTQVLASCALGSAAAATQDLVLPRMRGTATGAFFIGTTLIGLAMGPYLAGRIADLSGSLSIGLLSLLASVPIALVAAIAALRLVPQAEATRVERARLAGEPL
ncbi:spinster family MFS transporter [Sphingomonas hengshuiensis]|uniref:MFS transporter n=1 Tax=Sphingomonas hengshuiensis TaxID=1609977 RepID=A0A7U4JAF8_9SPHN|nr:MFS transporter [Sphingomonas hengshuiensis]AJP73193.1 MFS transporter [Sphingomonas hengshuiensis]